MHQEIKKADDIYQDIIDIDGIYKFAQVLSNQQNGQGKVYLVVKDQMHWFAAKIFLYEKDYIQESNILQHLKQCKNIAKVQYKNQAAKILRQSMKVQTFPVIIFEFMEKGDLCDFITKTMEYYKMRKCVYTIPMNVAKSLFYDILVGLRQIHDAKVLHKDLKLQNILLDCNFHARIGDFGLSGLKGQKIYGNKNIGTKNYRAPEAENGDQVKQYLPSSDIFVAGIIFYNICFYCPPFTITSQQNYKRFSKPQNKKGLNKLWQSIQYHKKLIIPQQVRQFFSCVFLQDPAKRPTIQQILQSKMMQDRASQAQVLKQMQMQYKKLTTGNVKVQNILKLKKTLQQAQKQRQKFLQQQRQKQKIKQMNNMSNEDDGDNQARSIGLQQPLLQKLIQQYSNQQEIKKQDLQISYYTSEVCCLTSSPATIFAWLQYFINTSCKQGGNLGIIQFLWEYKFKKYQIILDQEANSICIQLKFVGDEQTIVIVKLNARLLRRQFDNKIIIEWQKQGLDILCEIFLHDMKEAVEALYIYQSEQMEQMEQIKNFEQTK